MSPDLLVQKQRQQARRTDAGGKGTPGFKKPLASGKAPPTFSLQLMSAVQELKDKDGSDEESDFPSQRIRR